jgi:FixJ family two-component response regulator
MMSDSVFIIDDDLSIRRSLSFLLTAYGYNVETFSSSDNQERSS